MKLIRYIDEDGAYTGKLKGPVGTTFRDVFVHRPETCRYALCKVGRRIVVFDLFDAKIVHATTELSPGNLRIFPTVNAALAAVGLNYNTVCNPV